MWRLLGALLLSIHTMNAHFKIQFRDLILKRFGRHVATTNLLTLIRLVTRMASARDHVSALSTSLSSTRNIGSHRHRILVVQTSAATSIYLLIVASSLSMLLLIIEVADLLNDIGRDIANSLVMIVILNAVAAGPASLRRVIALLHRVGRKQINVARVNRDAVLLLTLLPNYLLVIHLALIFNLLDLTALSILVLAKVVWRDGWREVLHVNQGKTSVRLHLRRLLTLWHQWRLTIARCAASLKALNVIVVILKLVDLEFDFLNGQYDIVAGNAFLVISWHFLVLLLDFSLLLYDFHDGVPLHLQTLCFR